MRRLLDDRTKRLVCKENYDTKWSIKCSEVCQIAIAVWTRIEIDNRKKKIEKT